MFESDYASSAESQHSSINKVNRNLNETEDERVFSLNNK